MNGVSVVFKYVPENTENGAKIYVEFCDEPGFPSTTM